jgi:hypothetical protein
MKRKFLVLNYFQDTLSTHPVAGGLMKPRPLKPLSTKAEKYITVG